jgi:hypothetical protein
MGGLEGAGEELGTSQVQVRGQREDAGLQVKMGDRVMLRQPVASLSAVF